MVLTQELKVTQDGVIWPRRPLISSKGLLSCLKNLPYSTYEKRPATFRSVAFNCTGEFLAATDEKGRIFVFFVTNNRYALVQHIGVPTITCCFSPTRKTELLVTCENETARCIDVQTQALISTLKGHRYPARCASFQKSGNLALTASPDAVILWDTKDWSRFRILNAGPGVEQAMFVSRGDLVAVCFQDDSIMMWELDTLALRYRFSIPEYEESPGLKKIAVSNDYKILTASGHAPFLYVWDFESQTIIRIIELPSPIKEVVDHSFLPGNGHTTGILADDGSLFFLNAAASKPKIKLEISSRDRKFVAFAIEPNARYMACTSDDGCLLLYDLEIAKEAADRAVERRRNEGLKELEENALLPVRSGLIGKGRIERQLEQNHPQPSKLIEQIFGPRSVQRPAYASSKENIRNGSEGNKIGFDFSGKNQNPTKVNIVPTSTKTNHLKQKIGRAASTSILSKQNLSPDEIELNRKRLESSLRSLGKFPDKYRLLSWRFLLRLPKNEEAFRALVAKGMHPVFLNLEATYPLKNQRLLRRLVRVLSALTYWCPALGEVDYLPAFVYPFVKMSHANDLVAFEICLCLLLHFARDFFLTLPFAPISILSTLEKQLEQLDPQLHDHLLKHDISPEIYGWNLLKTLFTEVLSEDEWVCLWDHLFTYGTEKPQVLYTVVLAYLKYFRVALLSTHDQISLEQFFHQQNAIDIDAFIRLWINITKKFGESLEKEFSARFEEDDGEDSDKSKSGAKYWPLPIGQYPIFTSYPKFILNYQINERNRIALEEAQIVEKQKLLEKLEKESQKLKESQLKWTLEKQRLLALETKRAHEAMEIQKQRLYALQALDHETRKKRLEKLSLMEAQAQQTLEESAKWLQMETTRVEKQMEVQKQLHEYEITSRQEEEKVLQLEEESSRRVREIMKQREREERMEQMRQEMMARMNQMTWEELMKMEAWKKEDEESKRLLLAKIEKQEKSLLQTQEESIRVRMAQRLQEEMNRKKANIEQLEKERELRRKLEKEAEEEQKEEEAEEKILSAASSISKPVIRTPIVRKPLDQLKPREHTSIPSVSWQVADSENQEETSPAANLEDKENDTGRSHESIEVKKKKGDVVQSKLLSLSISSVSESSEESVNVRRTEEEMSLLEKALQDVSSSSNDTSVDDIEWQKKVGDPDALTTALDNSVSFIDDEESMIQRPIEELESELGIGIDQEFLLSDEEKKEEISPIIMRSFDPNLGSDSDDEIGDDRSSLLERAKRLLQEHPSE